jgi:hypothetical protein
MYVYARTPFPEKWVFRETGNGEGGGSGGDGTNRKVAEIGPDLGALERF